MTTAPSLADRLRIERVIWTVDTLAGDVPGPRRRELRRTLRADLWASAREVGAATAIRNLGPVRRLAAGYLDAEYGDDRPRPRYLKGVFWTILVEAVLGLLVAGRLVAFDTGLAAAGPGAGEYAFRPLGGWGPVYRVSYDETGYAGFVLDVTPALLPFVLVLVLAFLVGGRFWRALPAR
jgi:hypothetical protein